MPVAIRPAALNDVPAILAIEQQSPSAAHWTSEQYNKLVGSGVVLVAEEAGKLADSFARRRSRASGRSRTW
jgi:hypothetical protein